MTVGCCVSWQVLEFSLSFADKVSSSQTIKCTNIRVGSCLTRKYYVRSKKFYKEKHVILAALVTQLQQLTLKCRISRVLRYLKKLNFNETLSWQIIFYPRKMKIGHYNNTFFLCQLFHSYFTVFQTVPRILHIKQLIVTTKVYY